MREHRFAEVDMRNQRVRVQIDNVDGAAVRAGPTDARVSIDGHVREFPIRRDSELVAVHGDLYRSERSARAEVKENNGMFALVDDGENARWIRGTSCAGAGGEKSDERHEIELRAVHGSLRKWLPPQQRAGPTDK